MAKKKFCNRPIHITATKDIAVFVPGCPHRTFPLCVWNLQSNQVNEIGSFFSDSLCLYHADTDENALLTFEVNWDSRPPEVQQTKWSLSGGEQLHRKQFLVAGWPH